MELTPIHPQYLTESTELLEAAFPPIERRPTLLWKELMTEQPLFRAMAIVEEDRFCGLLTYWNFDTFLYVEHFAIAEHLRNGGYGKKALETFLREHRQDNVVLEVELPEDELACRRIGFYRRNGFHLIEERDYLQPPYTAGFEPMPLKLMTTQAGETRANYDLIVNKIHHYVYGVKK